MIEKELNSLKNVKKAEHLAYFFKTKKGEYGEGDIFLGITVPIQRNIAKKNKDASFEELQELLNSDVHEYRLTALLILVSQFKEKPELVYEFYIKNTKRINNWDLVDLSCSYILGVYLFSKKRNLLFDFSLSSNMWERRIAIVSTYFFIKNNDFEDTLKIAKILLKDQEDLIKKAIGWMLREVGKRDQKLLENFLIENYDELSRTTLRYAIERFEEQKRKRFLKRDF